VRWDPPVPDTQWVRRQVAENMPEPLSPLFEELYLKRGMELAMSIAMEMTGESDLVVDTGLPWYTTVNGFAYLCATTSINWRGLPKAVAALISGKMIRAMFGRAIPYWRDEVLPAHLGTVDRWKVLDLSATPDDRLLDGIRELAQSEGVYWGSTTLVLAVAKNSDLVLDRFLSIAMPKIRLSSALFLRGFPSRAIDGEAELQAIAEQIRASDELREVVGSTPPQRMTEALKAAPGGSAVVERLQEYLDRYGHQIYNLDFAEPTQAENPLPVLLSVKVQVQHPSKDVRARQAEMASDRERLVQQTARALDPIRRRLFVKILRWAQGLAYREEALFMLAPPGRRCAGSRWSWVGGWSIAARLPRPRTCSFSRPENCRQRVRLELLARPGRTSPNWRRTDVRCARRESVCTHPRQCRPWRGGNSARSISPSRRRRNETFPMALRCGASR
jgi:pyruvate,water dikinase